MDVAGVVRESRRDRGEARAAQAVRGPADRAAAAREAEARPRECFVCASGGTVERDERQCHDEAEEMRVGWTMVWMLSSRRRRG